MKWGVEELFIYEFVKVHYGNGSEGALECYFRRCNQSVLTEKIRSHGAIPFFHNAIARKTVSFKIPERLTREWEILAGRTALQNTFYEQEGAKTIEEIQDLGIRCILLKGFTNMERLYGDRMQRPVGDLDILIRSADYPGVKAHLLDRGFRQWLDKEVRPHQEKIQLGLRETLLQEMHFAKTLGLYELNVDVHWGFSSIWMFPVRDLYALSAYPWFEYTEKMTLDQRTVECLRPEMHFLTCVHHFALKNRFTGLKWLIDLCQYVVKFGHLLDWNFIDGLLHSPDSKKILYVVLKLVAEVTGDDHSPSVCKGVRSCACRIPDWEYRFYRNRLFAGSSLWPKYLCSALLPCKHIDRLKVIRFMLFHRSPFLIWEPDGAQLPQLLYPVYILMKGFREGLLLTMHKFRYNSDPMGVLVNWRKGLKRSYEMDATPKLADHIEINQVEDGYVIYQADLDRVHYLNKTAVLILEACTGENSVDAIGRIVREAFGLAETPQREVEDCLINLSKEGLII